MVLDTLLPSLQGLQTLLHTGGGGKNEAGFRTDGVLQDLWLGMNVGGRAQKAFSGSLQ